MPNPIHFMETKIKTQQTFPVADRILLPDDKPHNDLVKRYHEALAQCEAQVTELLEQTKELIEGLEQSEEKATTYSMRLRALPTETIKGFKEKLLLQIKDWTKVGHNNPHGVVDNIERVIKQME